jgi:cyclopropane fatty-acyl-phospholipid synthase-like methyltransferase
MGMEIDLLKNYPKSKRNLKERSQNKNEYIRRVARRFGKEFFDGDRNFGYGGFKYNPKFWQPVIPDFIKHWNLNKNSSLLDVGCAKGFMLYNLMLKVPGIKLKGIDISQYAIDNSKAEVKSLLKVADAKKLPFTDNSFDAVISINTIHNLDQSECAKALREIVRVSKKKAFITVDAYRNDDEKKKIYAWNLTAKTIMSVDDWKLFFKEVGYNGDYYWFIPY